MRINTPTLILCVSLLVTGCAAPLPSLKDREMDNAIVNGTDTRLGRAIESSAQTHPGKSGIYPLADPLGAFASRALLAAAAERSLDIQYYIWHGDETGYLMFEALWQAAERGVRVRLLLDDNNTAGLDQTIAALNAHPNIEVRLYNPMRFRSLRVWNYVADFSRANRRMHNKSFTADNQATIVGGRNIGNEYFGAGAGVAFSDLDVIAVGSVVQQVEESFELYWNSDSAYPAKPFVGSDGADASAALEAKFKEIRAAPDSTAYVEALRNAPTVQELVKGDLPLEWADTLLVQDDPAKTLDSSGRTDTLLLAALLPAVGPPKHAFDLVSPYFVPGKNGTKYLADLSESGVKVRILTNSLAATDVAAVHAGYAKHRRDLLRAGISLYELKPSALHYESEGSKKATGSSSASLHAKTFAVDGTRVFVGSFNFDPRSALLNTEMGLLIDSPALAGRLVEVFDEEVPQIAYEVRLTEDGDSLEWIERTPSGEKRYSADPQTGILRRAGVGVLSVLPIDWML